MPLFAVLALTSALAGPTGLPVLHDPAVERSAQERLVDRLRPLEAQPAPAAAREPDPDSPEGRRAAAWRADHLTCDSRRGRTRAQYARECAAWLTGRAAREAAAR